MPIVEVDERSIATAARILHEGGLVAFPTETVYGLGALASRDRAVGRVYAAKGRPSDNPLIAHVADRAAAAVFAQFDERAERLAEAFWPGPLTMVLPLKVPSMVSRVTTAGLATVAVRVPAHPVAQALLSAVELPVAAPSANRSGRMSPTTAMHVDAELGGLVDLILDGGACDVGVESTVVDLSRPDLTRLLRPGGIERRDIAALVDPLLDADPMDAKRGPGMLTKHYSPDAALRLDATDLRAGEALLAFGPDFPVGCGEWRNLSAKGDLDEAAANLYAMLRELDATRPRAIAVMPVPPHGVGEAINDRLRRAAVTLSSATAA